QRLQRSDQLQTFAAVVIASGGEQRPKVRPLEGSTGGLVFFNQIRVKEKQNPRPLAVQRRRMSAIVFVERPEKKITFKDRGFGVAEQRPDAVRGLTFAAGKDNQRPGRAHFVIFFPRLFGDRQAKRPWKRGRIPPGRTLVTVERQKGLVMFGICSAEAEMLVEENGPEREELFVPADGFRFHIAVWALGHLFVFVARQRPELPAFQGVAMAEVEKGVEIIVGDDILLARLAKKRKQNKTDIVPE